MDNPKFFQDYIDSVTNDVACSKLISLSTEYKKKIKEINDDATEINRNSAAFQYKQMTGEKLENDAASKRKSLENEYKKKAMEVAQPHIDTVTFEKLVQQHAPEEDRQNKITNSQSKLINQKEKHKLSPQTEREKMLKELQQRWAQNRDMTKNQ